VEQVSDVVKLAQIQEWALLTWGSGTKMGLGNVPSRLDLVLRTDRLNRIIDMDTANLTATAQAGVKFKELQVALAGEEDRCYLPYETPTAVSDQAVCSDREHMGCFIPLMPPHIHSATLGGVVAANSSGPTRLLYGLPRDMILGVRYVSSNGEIVGSGGKPVKNVSGYDMCKLMIGSYGSLGVLCEMTLRLLPLPERLSTCLLSFAALEEASQFVDRVFETRLVPAAVDLLNKRAMALLQTESAAQKGNNGYTVAVALEGFEEAVDRMASEIKEMASDSGAVKDELIHEDAHRTFWEARSNLVSGLKARYPELVSVKINYPISSYQEVVQWVESLGDEHNLEYALQVHAGSGVSQIQFLVNPRETQATGQVVTVVEELLERSSKIGGHLVVETAGIQLKERVPVWGAPRKDLMIMKRIKTQMDPYGLFCPGRFVGGI